MSFWDFSMSKMYRGSIRWSNPQYQVRRQWVLYSQSLVDRVGSQTHNLPLDIKKKISYWNQGCWRCFFHYLQKLVYGMCPTSSPSARNFIPWITRHFIQMPCYCSELNIVRGEEPLLLRDTASHCLMSIPLHVNSGATFHTTTLNLLHPLVKCTKRVSVSWDDALVCHLSRLTKRNNKLHLPNLREDLAP